MDRYLIAYAGTTGLDIMTAEDMRMLTHVNLAFGVIRDGVLSMQNFPRLKAQLERVRAYNPAVRFVLSPSEAYREVWCPACGQKPLRRS